MLPFLIPALIGAGLGAATSKKPLQGALLGAGMGAVGGGLFGAGAGAGAGGLLGSAPGAAIAPAASAAPATMGMAEFMNPSMVNLADTSGLALSQTAPVAGSAPPGMLDQISATANKFSPMVKTGSQLYQMFGQQDNNLPAPPQLTPPMGSGNQTLTQLASMGQAGAQNPMMAEQARQQRRMGRRGLL